MNKTLKTIQVLAKIGRVLSLIVFIACIVGASGCVLGLITFILGVGEITIDGVTLKSILEIEAGISQETLYIVMIGAVFACASEAVVAKFAEIYFKNEIAKGTPFTFEGQKELFRLGIISIAVPLGCDIVVGIIQGILLVIFTSATQTEISVTATIGYGVAFLITSLLIRYSLEKDLEASYIKSQETTLNEEKSADRTVID